MTQHPSFREPFRPQFHYSPARNWINDPNGLFFYQGEYHIFYQYNPFGNEWGNMSWGHAISRDMVHWEELPVAIEDDGDVMIFSGSAVVDHQNTSGFGSDDSGAENPPLVAIYTGHQRVGYNQSQYLAYSLDRGRTWTKYGKRVLDVGMTAFRDPKVFWHDASQQWIMVLALPDDHKAAFYGSSDLKNWTLLSHFGPAGHTGGIWEVPELFELPTPEGDTRWVLKLDLNPGGPHGGSGCQYWVGHFDGTTFEAQQEARWVDHGKDFYAALSFSNLEGRRIWLAWMNNWEYSRDIPREVFNGHMSIPRVLSLQRDAEGLALVQTPIPELEVLRGEPTVLSALPLTEQATLLHQTQQTTLEIELELEMLDAAETGLKFVFGGQEEVTLIWQKDTSELLLQRNSKTEAAGFNGAHTAVLNATKETLNLRIFLDWSSIEVFAEGGKTVISDLVYPSSHDLKISGLAQSGSAQIRHFKLWPLRAYR
ncbi:glycoside hydrolase family 32 protein [Deinococcus roseus]|uniref:Levanase n=1 Tax=Deinococcus roseus TaxID=392414 RepID=A0ABQ2D0R3_9DEIO|nr:glycoside hydrolase family 32 protein [Deinococcus roseus]GGJ39549.1 hypothetical protein GCM10008938_27030 [Deinococcus roseus]